MDINKTNQYPFHVTWTTKNSKTDVTECMSIGISFKNHFLLHVLFLNEFLHINISGLRHAQLLLLA